MIDTDTITVYWSPGFFVSTADDSWHMAYSDPTPLSLLLHKMKNTEADNRHTMIHGCPAHQDLFNNVFVFNHTFDNTFDLPTDLLKNLTNDNVFHNVPTKSPVQVGQIRHSSFKGYVNIAYKMGWLLFADEPVTARFTAPYYPPTTPTVGAMLSSGEFDIGSWYRIFTMDYHVPLSSSSMTFKENDPLMYVELKTNKKVIFKRYNLTPTLHACAMESANAPDRYGSFKSLLQRYELFNKTSRQQHILSEIKKSLIE